MLPPGIILFIYRNSFKAKAENFCREKLPGFLKNVNTEFFENDSYIDKMLTVGSSSYNESFHALLSGRNLISKGRV